MIDGQWLTADGNESRRPRTTRPRRGRAAVEAATIIGLLFLLMMGICEYGRLIMLRQVVENACREGARYAVVSTGATSGVTTSQVQSYTTGFLAGQSYSGLTVQVYLADPTTGTNIGSWTSASFGAGVAVQIDLDFQPAVPYVMPSTIHVRFRSVMACEAN
jgi:Flp pilus assembly protein TadG